jgi:hypothetical protein
MGVRSVASSSPARKSASSSRARSGAASKATTATKSADRREITVSVPSLERVAGGAANAVLLPLAAARQFLPAKGGLPLYIGLGMLGAADVLDWPVAIGIGVGYAVLRPGGPLAPAHVPAAARSES